MPKVSGKGGVPPYREARARGPGAVAGGADDAGLVEVAGSNEACQSELVKRYCTWPRMVLFRARGVARFRT
jgi:hypothetical protein